MLGNDIHLTNLVELVGKKGSGKTQMLFLICAINSINNKKIMYLDGSGNFRPERIKSMIEREIGKSKEQDIDKVLKNIRYQRIYDLEELSNSVKRSSLLNLDFIILDDIIPLFLYKFKENTRLELRKFIRELALLSILKKITIIFTNTIIERYSNKNKLQYELFYHDIIRYVHIKILLQIIQSHNKVINCSLVYPKSPNQSNIEFDLNNL